MRGEIIQENLFFSCVFQKHGIVSLVIDMKEQKTNLMIFDFMTHYFEVMHEILSLQEVKGVVITSARSDFIAGADINEFLDENRNSKAFLDGLLDMHKEFARLDHYGKPIISIIKGNCIGGGYEFVLNTHYRIAVKGAYKIGLPETKLGLFPGAGGAIKTARMWGIAKAIRFVVNGSVLSPSKAYEFGVVDAFAEDAQIAWELAAQYILEGKPAIHKWGNHQAIPGGDLNTANGGREFAIAVQWIKNKTKGHYPGINNYLKTLHDGLGIPVEKALEVEARYLVKTLQSRVAQNMINTLFFGVQKSKKNPYLTEHSWSSLDKIKKIGIVGGGMMGSGIAAHAVCLGFEVVLLDIDDLATSNAIEATNTLIKAKSTHKNWTADQLNEVRDLLKQGRGLSDFEDVDLVIEAITEDVILKKTVYKSLIPHLKSDAILASNTSSISLDVLFEDVVNKHNTVGLHFFSPVNKMMLIEIIRGSQTATKTLSRVYEFTKDMGKIPIVVNDSPGFYTSRVFGKYTLEAVLLFLEGTDPMRIENVATKVGWPLGPFSVLDEVSLTLVLDVLSAQPVLSEEEKKYKTFLKDMVKQGRLGKKSKMGFYTYSDHSKELWLKPIGQHGISDREIEMRLNYTVALDSFRCLTERVITDTVAADMGSILGFGFPLHTGGVFRYMDDEGLESFVSICNEFKAHGAQWEVPNSLKSLRSNSFHFYEGSKSNWIYESENS